MILIYSNQITPRLKYTFQLVFEQILGQTIECIQDKNIFKNASIPKINYSSEAFSDALFVQNAALLFEKSIAPQTIRTKKWNELTAFYFHENSNSALPFDPFAMIFYLVSRYEEYLPAHRDEHQRYKAISSLAFRNNFLKKPLVNQLALVLKGLMEAKYPTLKFQLPHFLYTPTYDIDYAWSYLHKGWKRTLGGTARAFLKQPKQLPQRVRVLSGQEQDPYFTFDFLDAFHQRHRLSPIYFFLVGKHGAFDKNISIQKKAFQQLIRQIAERHPVGIHPSYQSNSSIDILKTEKNNLAKVAQIPIKISRQHYLKLEFPTTYQRLLQIGIEADYTMGYAEQVGFRASIATPFFWFDLSKNEATRLRVFPFQVMDITLKNYLQLQPEEAIALTRELFEATKSVNGHFISLWHNNSLCEQEGWQGWRKVMEMSCFY